MRCGLKAGDPEPERQRMNPWDWEPLRLSRYEGEVMAVHGGWNGIRGASGLGPFYYGWWYRTQCKKEHKYRRKFSRN